VGDPDFKVLKDVQLRVSLETSALKELTPKETTVKQQPFTEILSPILTSSRFREPVLISKRHSEFIRSKRDTKPSASIIPVNIIHLARTEE
jgi:hypothetical protein